LDADGLLTLDPIPDVEPPPPLDVDVFEFEFSDDFDEHYGLLAPKTTVLVRAYLDDGDDQVLAEIRPSFVVMFEPNEDFIRRIEVSAVFLSHHRRRHRLAFKKVFRCLNPGIGVRVYHMLYKDSCEEHKLLSSMRREKGSFERLIKERGVRLQHPTTVLAVIIFVHSSDYAPSHNGRYTSQSRGPNYQNYQLTSRWRTAGAKHTAFSGCGRPPRIPVDAAVPAACQQVARDSCDAHGWRLYFEPDNVRGEEEFGRSDG
jgi:hypothetical protein